jgi:hypothetical protein
MILTTTAVSEVRRADPVQHAQELQDKLAARDSDGARSLLVQTTCLMAARSSNDGRTSIHKRQGYPAFIKCKVTHGQPPVLSCAAVSLELF